MSKFVWRAATSARVLALAALGVGTPFAAVAADLEQAAFRPVAPYRIAWSCDYPGGTTLFCRAEPGSGRSARPDASSVELPLHALPFDLNDVHRLARGVLCAGEAGCEIAMAATGDGATRFGRLSGHWRDP